MEGWKEVVDPPACPALPSTCFSGELMGHVLKAPSWDLSSWG